MSVIALLALTCFPVLAQADSSGAQYTDALPKPEGDNSPAKKKKSPTAKSSTENGGDSVPNAKSAPESEDSNDGSEEGDSSEKGGGVPVGGNDDDKGQGSPGGSAKEGKKAPAQAPDQAQSPPAAEKSDSGSSPLVPILVAILILAAISVAVVMIRQRRQGGSATPASEAS